MPRAPRSRATRTKRLLGEFGVEQAKARKNGDYDIKVAETYYGYGRYADAVKKPCAAPSARAA